MRLVVVGGGTAGHVIPALPVIEALQARGMKVSFIGTRSGLEEALVKDLEIPFYGISAGKLRRYFSWQNFTDLARIVRGTAQAFVLLRRIQPSVVFSKGGFVSFPVAFAAWMQHIPVVAHESDITPGLANRLVLPFVKTLCISFPQTRVGRSRVRVVHTGTPLRDSILKSDPEKGLRLLGIDGARPLLVVTGGSLGADAINAVIRDALPGLLDHYEVLHVCGSGKRVDIDAQGYTQKEFVGDGWGDMLAAAEVVVSRAGANALFELLTMRKLNLLVPLPARASRGDQLQNADYARQQGFSVVIPEEEFTAQSLLDGLAELRRGADQYQKRLAGFERVDAVSAIVEELLRAGSLS